jgi:nucleoside-diphosphate kinase
MGNLRKERTLFLIKPDGVKKGLIGETIKRMENVGLKIVALKVIKPTRKLIEGHLPKEKEWVIGLGNKTLNDYKTTKQDPVKEMGSADPYEIGLKIKEWLIEYLTSGIIIAGIAQGSRAIEFVRKIMGNTNPILAEAGSIRGDFSNDSPSLANSEKRAIANVTHASGDAKEATQEIANWFKPEEIIDYEE